MSERTSLLDLPKELRLEIWQYVVGSSKQDAGHLWIRRDLSGQHTSAKRFSNSLYKCSSITDINFSLESAFLLPGFANLLHVNRLIYFETLPILYSSITFHPCDLQGTFSLFLGMLSEFALSCIRRVSLDVQFTLDSPGSFFYWAVTCAQVAKLGRSLRSVVVLNAHALTGKDTFTKHAILFPLLKIKTSKEFLPGTFLYSKPDNIQSLVKDVTKEFEAKAAIRRAATAADAATRARRNSDEPAPVFKRQVSSLAIRDKLSNHYGVDLIDESRVTRELSTISGIEQFKKELLEWDMVSIRSASPESEAGHTDEKAEDTWTETASTLAAKDPDSSDDDWELV